MVFIIQLKTHNTYNNEQFIFVDQALSWLLTMSNPHLQILTMSNWLKKDLDERTLIVNYYWFNHFLIVGYYRYFFWNGVSGSQKQSKFLLKILIFKLEEKLRLYSEYCLLNRFFYFFRDSNTDTVSEFLSGYRMVGYWQAQFFGVTNLKIICSPCICYLKHCVLKWKWCTGK